MKVFGYKTFINACYCNTKTRLWKGRYHLPLPNMVIRKGVKKTPICYGPVRNVLSPPPLRTAKTRFFADFRKLFFFLDMHIKICRMV